MNGLDVIDAAIRAGLLEVAVAEEEAAGRTLTDTVAVCAELGVDAFGDEPTCYEEYCLGCAAVVTGVRTMQL